MKSGDYVFLISCILFSYILYLCNPYAVIGGILFMLYSFIVFYTEDK